MAVTPVSHADGRVEGMVALTTDYVLRSVSRSDGSPALQADVHFQGQSGWLAGAWISSVDVNQEDGGTVELSAYFGLSRPVAVGWSVTLLAAHYAYPRNTPDGLYAYDELTAGVAYRDLVFVTLAVSPNTPYESSPGLASDRTALSYEVALQHPLAGAWSAHGGLGYYDLRGAEAYTYWNAGVSYDFSPWRVEMAWFGAAPDTPAIVNEDTTRSHWAATLTWRF